MVPSLIAASLLALATLGGTSAPVVHPAPVEMAIIIDDIGYTARDQGAVELPGAVTIAVLPFTPHGATLARDAHRRGKEVMVHMPMASDANLRLGPGGIEPGMSPFQIRERIEAAIAAVPYAIGMNNHMGSRITADTGNMRTIMATLANHPGFYFVDSRTSAATVAEAIAAEFGIASQRRHLFIDPDPSPPTVARQYDELLRRARHGEAPIAIGHPYPATLALLQRELPKLAAEGIRLVPASQLMHHPRPPFASARYSLRQSLTWPTPAVRLTCTEDLGPQSKLARELGAAGAVSISNWSR